MALKVPTAGLLLVLAAGLLLVLTTRLLLILTARSLDVLIDSQARLTRQERRRPEHQRDRHYCCKRPSHHSFLLTVANLRVSVFGS